MDHNIREAIEMVLEGMLEDGEDLSKIQRADPGGLAEGVRRWEITVRLPVAA